MISILFISCDSLVDVEPKGFIIPTKASDLRMMLNNTSGNFMKPRPVTIGYSLVQYLGDQTYYLDDDNIESFNEDVYSYYTRNKELIEDHNYGDILYLYQLVALSNSVLDILPSTSDLSKKERDQIEGEALVHRSYAFFIMVNIHGRHYDKNTSNTDLGIPMPLNHNVVEGKIPSRSSVGEVYKKITDDLKKAIKLLGDIQNNKALPSRAAANALLSRVFLFMGDFKLALTYANNALSESSFIYNLEDYVDSKGIFTEPDKDYKSKEVLLFKEIQNSVHGASAPRYVSSNFYSLYEDGDLRKGYYKKDNSNPSRYLYSYFPYTFSGILNSELYLIRAECNARANNLQLALKDINYIRNHRFLSKKYTPLVSNDKNQVMDWVIRERKIELAWVGLRWFDMKRLNKDSNSRYHITLSRTYKGKTIVYTPNSDLWVLPFPRTILEKV